MLVYQTQYSCVAGLNLFSSIHICGIYKTSCKNYMLPWIARASYRFYSYRFYSQTAASSGRQLLSVFPSATLIIRLKIQSFKPSIISVPNLYVLLASLACLGERSWAITPRKQCLSIQATQYHAMIASWAKENAITCCCLWWNYLTKSKTFDCSKVVVVIERN